MNSKIRRIHMVGIGGAGMSGIAEVLLNQGYEVSGSDMSDSAVVRHLRDLGAHVAVGHAAENVGDVQVLVKSTAINDENPELIEARRRNIAIIPRAEMLAELMRLRQGIAIAGTHGKTTTTSLTASIFDTAELDPTVIIGGRLNAYGTNAHLGHGEYLIAEADESDGSFLCLLPIINVVTNVDEDHLDHYKTRQGIDDAFVQFMNNVPFYGLNIVCGDDPGVRALLARVKRPVLTYGFAEDNVLRAVPLECGVRNNFEVWRNGVKLGQVSLPQPGRHNMLNALAAIGAAMEVDISFEKCAEGLNGFGGVGRRFEFKGEKGGVTVVDDYGHHPAEIAATLATARQVFPGRRIVAAFQPHRFSRTQAHFGEFCKVFDNVDQLLLTEIYAASEKPIPGVSGQSLAQGIRQVSITPVEYYQTLNDLAAALPNVLREGDVLLTLGAGSITRLGPAWLEGQDHA
ncbi:MULTISPECIES: UDP-N-acetylmuramate--L-alanine ligase [Desulfovibrio]|jgi:UDP-N-acetylmuramate--alanine ligase|uniref:UDP-N-acetylmuramate--L-alanine ligase n=2 Tax=root TaxID=1 RepID=A0A212KK18_9BACT|nr:MULTISPECIES: UDP-N-acetylmuramate--L-alanine ligase [Desulfovibrio]MBD8895144.1 UDP-N-acetylmuramate--L-alanine ligase [Desulfovibrio desulfuricans]MBT9749384.1 UDP-N-acetylmuramate--L-alanine ligase [Desulfovibrio desulfuricans]MCB6540992.1 UDP-N-acetylmuramate--L-alanine ligase [Desulfovibrio desulfuricans]MCB6552074.1 UDP-N-acetylmuramate--L-alanine ligase [Desulfovibrio desulfuricans]MCB6563916.1 UDP-N-acetylmuramate--L-alanine ligase [Desulfovibrio desulfuricans]